MQAVILCGGRGTRLREHNETLPKPMVEVGGRPIVWHIMKLYAANGITDFVVPRNALTEEEHIEVEVLQVRTQWGTVTLYEFDPDGLVFRKPAVLTLDCSDREEGEWLRLFWFNPASLQGGGTGLTGPGQRRRPQHHRCCPTCWRRRR